MVRFPQRTSRVERDTTPRAGETPPPHEQPRREAATDETAAVPRPVKATPTRHTLSADKEWISGGFEFALGTQPVSELVGAALLEVDEVRALGDLLVTGLPGPRLGFRALADFFAGFVGLAVMMILPCRGQSIAFRRRAGGRPSVPPPARQLDPDRHLDQAADPHLLDAAECIEHNPIEQPSRVCSTRRARPPN